MKKDSADPLVSVPKGFKVTRYSPETLHIEYRHSGMGCMVIFLMVWISGWTLGCVFLVREALSHSPFENPGAYLFAIPFLLGEVIVGTILLWILFGRTHFFLEPDGLRLTRRLFTWSKTRVFPLDEINGFTQVKDGGGGEDSFPSWGLVIKAPKSVNILSRQDPDKSLWLGELLSRWSGKEFSKSPDAPSDNSEE